MLLLMGFLRLGFLANFLSHSVVSGFISASGLLIAASQIKTLMGVQASGDNFFALVWSLVQQIPDTNVLTLVVGGVATVFLFWVRQQLKPLLIKLGLNTLAADSPPLRYRALERSFYSCFVNQYRWLCRVCFGRSDTGCAKTRAHRTQPRTGRLGRLQRLRILDRRLSRHRWLCPLCRQRG